ncbi:MAG: rhomboid family intramembrane serine protease [Alphaproteobacteria bacterium]|jgi:membrane associated rhomboid family serine protease|nr:rhomboid family intramembrane serine protease [Alphaproteobacteria bacterium]
MTDQEPDNIIKFAPRISDKPPTSKWKPNHPPMFNIPPATKYLAGSMVAIYFLIWISGLFLLDGIENLVAYIGGFTSGSWTGAAPFFWWTPITPITSILLHGSWMHIGMNSMMLIAIGSGVEKWLGVKRYLALFVLSSFIALLTHMAFSPYSTMPVIGASGGVSGLFGAILLGMRSNENNVSSPLGSNMLPVIIAWVAISVLVGIIGSPDGSSVAWVAHIGGFIGGIGVASLMMKKKLRR